MLHYHVIMSLQDNCLQNPANINRKRSVAIPLRSNQSQSSSHGIVHIPCDICQESIDLPNWSYHIVKLLYTHYFFNKYIFL